MIAASSAMDERRLDELLHHDDGQPLRRDQLADDLVELVDDDRGQAHGELVEQQDLRVGRQRPGHGEHPLLAARQRARQLLAPVGQRGEALEGLLLHLRALEPGRRNVYMSRFSETVRFGKMDRPSGIMHTPDRARCSVAFLPSGGPPPRPCRPSAGSVPRSP